jgi:hypothetical protein
MKTLKFFLIIAIFYSCNKEDEYSGSFDINGKVKYDNGISANNSQIYLNNEFKTTTNSEGDFAINEVNAGKYTLKATSSDSSNGYSEVIVEIDLKDDDLNLGSLLLPVPVKLLEPTDVTSHSIKLIWNKCNASDFREYKIYIHNSSALDENTGTLLHITTSVNDTILSVNEGDFWWGGSTLTPNTTYYFRVFVVNSYGRMSGSNIIKVKTSLWDNADKFTSNYNIKLQVSFAAQGDLTGIAWDGYYFWMLYFEELGGYYDNNRVTLVKYDLEQGTTLDTIIFDDSNYFPAGITWDGTNIWISFETYIQSVDIENETLDKKYYAGESTVDLAWDNENLLLLDVWNKVTFINPKNGIITQQFDTPFKVIGYSGEKGITYRDGEIWIINNWHDEICILDRTGNHIGVAEVDFLQEGMTANGHRMPMCFMDEKLVIAFDSQVRIYSIEKKE